jgi:hypothetical protein
MQQTLTERGKVETRSSLADAIGRLRREREEIAHQIGVLEVKVQDLAKIEAALLFAADMLKG